MLLTRSQVAERLSVSPHQAGYLMLEMPTVMVGKRKRVTEEVLAEYIKRHTNTPQAPVTTKRTKKPDPELFDESGRIKLRRTPHGHNEQHN